MKNTKTIEWVLRVGIFGEFLGHGVFSILGKVQWVKWIQEFGVADPVLALNILYFIGVMDVILAILVLLKPMRPLLLWMTFWGFWTALVRPIVGEPIWDFVERSANWAAPLALLLMLPGSQDMRDWFCAKNRR